MLLGWQRHKDCIHVEASTMLQCKRVICVMILKHNDGIIFLKGRIIIGELEHIKIMLLLGINTQGVLCLLLKVNEEGGSSQIKD